MWRVILGSKNCQGTNFKHMLRRIIYGMTLRIMNPYCWSLREMQLQNYITTFSNSKDSSEKTKYMFRIQRFISLVSLCESTMCYQMYCIDGNNKDKALKESYKNVNMINLNLREHEHTPVPPPSLSSSDDSTQDIINLDESNFESELKKYKFTLVMFHAPWCQFCQDIKPLFYRLSKEIPSDVAKMAMLDGEEFPTIALDNDVQVFPTFKLYRRGVFVKDYDGPGQYSGLLEFVKSNATV